MLNTLNLRGVETDTIATAADGIIFTGNDDGEILIIKGREVTRVAAHSAGIKRLCISAEGQLLASVSYDRTLSIWQVGNLGIERRHITQLPAIIWPRACTFLDERQLVFGTFGSSYAVYNLDTGNWQTEGIEGDISLNAVTYNGGKIYTVGDAGIVFCDGTPMQDLGSLCNFLLPVGERVLTAGQIGEIFDAVSGTLIYKHHSPLNCGAIFERHGWTHVVFGAYTGEGLVFRIVDDQPIHLKTLRLHNNAVKGIACSEDEIFSVCANGVVAFHRIDDFSKVNRMDQAHDRIANGCVALPGGQFASISRDLTMRIWSGVEVTVHQTPHRNSIKCIAASVDGQYLCTGVYVGVIAVFELMTSTWCLVTRPTAAGISSLAPIPATSGFMATSYDGRLYPIALT